MENKKVKSIIEAILFTMGEAVEIDRIAKTLEMDKKEVRSVLEEMMDDYLQEDRGLRIIEIDDSFQLCTKGEAYEYLVKLVKIPRNYKLTDVQLETLSIIAYKQPVTKIEIEKIRGVQSDHAINRLVECGLVEETGRLNQPGRPILFGTSEEFLRRFGLKNTEELPDINVEKMESFKLEAEKELGYISEEEADKDSVELQQDAIFSSDTEEASVILTEEFEEEI